MFRGLGAHSNGARGGWPCPSEARQPVPPLQLAVRGRAPRPRTATHGHTKAWMEATCSYLAKQTSILEAIQHHSTCSVPPLPQGLQPLKTTRLMLLLRRRSVQAAKAIEQNSNEASTRLKREVIQALCGICHDAKPSRAFVVVCSSCWDGFAQNSDGRCPDCRQDVQFSFPVLI